MNDQAFGGRRFAPLDAFNALPSESEACPKA
jgi:hypothetical protein